MWNSKVPWKNHRTRLEAPSTSTVIWKSFFALYYRDDQRAIARLTTIQKKEILERNRFLHEKVTFFFFFFF